MSDIFPEKIPGAALGLGMLLACLLPRCVFLIGGLLLGCGIWLVSKSKRF